MLSSSEALYLESFCGFYTRKNPKEYKKTGCKNSVAYNSNQFQDINSKKLSMSFIEKDEALDTTESVFPSNDEKIYFAWWG